MTITSTTTAAPIVVQLAFVRRSLIHTLRTPDALIMATVFPVILMFLFTFVFGGAIDPSGEYVNYIVPGIVLLCAGFGAAGVAVDVANDMTNGIIDRFRTMPVRAGAVITGHVITSLLRNLLATAIVVAVAVAIGFRPTASPGQWLLAALIITGYILAITYLFAAIGLAASSPEAASGFGFIIMFVPYLSSAFVPVETMPVWLHWIAENQPLTPIIETVRALLRGGEVGDGGAWAAAWIGVILVGAAAWSSWMFRRTSGRR